MHLVEQAIYDELMVCRKINLLIWTDAIQSDTDLLLAPGQQTEVQKNRKQMNERNIYKKAILELLVHYPKGIDT